MSLSVFVVLLLFMSSSVLSSSSCFFFLSTLFFFCSCLQVFFLLPLVIFLFCASVLCSSSVLVFECSIFFFCSLFFFCSVFCPWSFLSLENVPFQLFSWFPPEFLRLFSDPGVSIFYSSLLFSDPITVCLSSYCLIPSIFCFFSDSGALKFLVFPSCFLIPSNFCVFWLRSFKLSCLCMLFSDHWAMTYLFSINSWPPRFVEVVFWWSIFSFLFWSFSFFSDLFWWSIFFSFIVVHSDFLL